MKSSYPLAAMGLLALGFAVDWRLSRAQESEKPASALHAVQMAENANVSDLLDRIDALEKRLAMVESRDSLVRQADSRESAPSFQPKLVPQGNATQGNDEEDEDDAQKTNGQQWRFRLLSHH